MKKTIVKSVTTFAVFVSLPAVADQYTYPGAICQSRADFSNAYYYSGRAVNKTSDPIDLICPLQRNFTSTSMYENATVRVTVRDMHFSKNVCCTAYLREADGDILSASAEVCSSGSNSAHTVLSLNLPEAYAGSNGYLVLHCELPEMYLNDINNVSMLASIEVVE